ncbi:MAG: cytochrome C oxidase subunit IV family protein [Candidatus Binatia bacterium]
MNQLAIEEEHGHVVPYTTFITVWAILLVLTMILTLVSKVFHEALSVWAMLTITPLKAGLVFYYFMHLKFEGPLLKAMVFVALATLVVFIGMLFLDSSIQ